jgi:RHS repeat-associated protein
VVSKGDRATRVRFPGQYHDEETGLHYNLKRYYDPEISRYLSPDPFGVEGGLNLYAYCVDPITSYDPFGLDPHGLQFAVFKKDGKTQVGPDDPSMGGAGNWSPLQSGANGAPFTGTKKDRERFGQLGTGDTEQKALHLLDTNDNARKALQDGGTAKMSGQFPPCKSCHRAMKKWMKEKGQKGHIEYHYPVNQKITYHGGDTKEAKGGTPVETKKGSNANKLVGTYDDDHIHKRPREDWEWQKNKDGSQKYKDGKMVIKKQDQDSSDEYQRQKAIAQKNPGKVEWPP